jgi:uncharacterized protein YggE
MKNVFFALGTILILGIFVSISPLNKINWGRISILPAATITVTGSAEGQTANQMATFGASVTATNANKDTATNTVNTKMDTLIKSLKDFGIADADIKTENLNVYQMATPNPQTGSTQTLIYPVPPQTTGSGDWSATNSISITLRDVSKASALTDLLNKSGATDVYGPNFSVDENFTNDTDLLMKAMNDAKSKAETIAKSSGQTLGPVINVQENGGYSPVYPLYAATKDSASAVPAPVQPGTTTINKTVTVVYEIR